jgi:hypothetical protein
MTSPDGLQGQPDAQTMRLEALPWRPHGDATSAHAFGILTAALLNYAASDSCGAGILDGWVSYMRAQAPSDPGLMFPGDACTQTEASEEIDFVFGFPGFLGNHNWNWACDLCAQNNCTATLAFGLCPCRQLYCFWHGGLCICGDVLCQTCLEAHTSAEQHGQTFSAEVYSSN